MNLSGLPVSFRRGLYRLRFTVKQSNLLILSDRIQAVKVAVKSVLHHRSLLEKYVYKNPVYVYALNPVKVPEHAPKIVKLAAETAEIVGVGPMAAVPGVLADLVVEDMKPYCLSVSMVENGGEIAASSKIPLNIGVYAGFSPVSGKFGFRLKREDFPVGLATSSATVSHALSFGEADAVVVFSQSAGFADAAATAICNEVKGKDVEASVQKGLEKAESIPDVRAVLIVRGRYIGKMGRLPQIVWLNGGLEDLFEAGMVML